MSIWTDLLFLHGHIATPAALALVTSPRLQAAPPVAGPDQPPPRAPIPATETVPVIAGAPARSAVSPPVMYVHHPLRTVGQLP